MFQFISGEGIDRKAYIRIGCPQDWTINDLAVVVSVVETDKCLYEIELHSPLFCGMRYLSFFTRKYSF